MAVPYWQTDAQRSPWKQPGLITVIAVICIANLVADWLWFKPPSLAVFLIVEVVIVGGISWLAIRVLSRRPPRT